jgi:hypothetical protein
MQDSFLYSILTLAVEARDHNEFKVPLSHIRAEEAKGHVMLSAAKHLSGLVGGQRQRDSSSLRSSE